MQKAPDRRVYHIHEVATCDDDSLTFLKLMLVIGDDDGVGILLVTDKIDKDGGMVNRNSLSGEVVIGRFDTPVSGS